MAKAWIYGVMGSLAMSGCTCSRASDGAGAADPDAGAGPRAVSGDGSAQATVGASDPRYSAPIAAGRITSGDIFVAGLVVAAGAIELTRLQAAGPDGGARAVLWTKPVLSGVKWAADAELAVHTLGPGLAVSWEGLRAGKAGRFVQLVTVDGEPQGQPFEVGGSVCTTTSELAWPETDARGVRIVARGWEGGAREVGRLAADREPMLACGTTRIFATGEGDDDVTLAIPASNPSGAAAATGTAAGPGTGTATGTAATTGPGGGARTVRLIAAGDFPAKDEERSHALYTWGDELGVVRVGASGGLARREVGDAMSPWVTSARPLAEDDDVEAVDADARAIYVVWTHDADDGAAGGCGDSGASASSVHVRVLPRAAPNAGASAAASAAESDVTLAPTDCARDVGPFWTERLGDDLVITWAERASRVDRTTPPIAALSYRRMRGTQIVAQGKVDAEADAVESAGCDANHCYAAALHRLPGTDMMAPEAARVLQYP